MDQTLIDAKQQRNLEAPSRHLCWRKRNQLACATHHKDDDPGDFVLQAQRVPPVAELAGLGGAGWISVRLQADSRILLRRIRTRCHAHVDRPARARLGPLQSLLVGRGLLLLQP